MGIDRIEKFDFVPDTKVQVGNESILTYQLSPNRREITFKGLKPGKTSLTLRNNVGDVKARYLINVTANEKSNIVKELRDFLGDIEGLKIGIKSGTVFVGGKIFVPSDIGRIIQVLRQDKFKEVLFLVELSPQTRILIAREMQREIQKNGLRDVTVRVINGLYWLEGVVSSEGEKTRAELIAQAFYPQQLLSLAERNNSVAVAQKDAIQNFIQVNAKQSPPPIPKLVKITAQFVELSKDYAKVFGFSWQPFIGTGDGNIRFGRTTSDGVTTSSNGTLSGTISNLFPKLNSAKQAGHARVIQSGVILVKDNVQGKIEKSETVNFALGTNEFTTPRSATAGFTLNITPSILQEEKIDLKIGLSVSTNVGTPPRTQRNDVSTSLIVRSRESAVVGGVVVNKNSTDYDKDPPGGVTEIENAKPLFTFLRSKSMTSTKSQFVVFITPEIVDSAAEGADEIKRKFRRRRR